MATFKQKIQAETSQILQEAGSNGIEYLTEAEVDHLPAPVKKWLTVSGAIGSPKARVVWLKQKFLMKLKPTQKKWNHAVAQQLFTVKNPAFIWTVRLKMAPLVTITGRDKLVEGKGEMQMNLNGIINLGKETGEKMDEGTLQRYLGETAWFPSAVVNPFIRWEEISSQSARATITHQGTTGSGTFHFNEQGQFKKFSTFRFMGNQADAKRYQWVITAQDYAQFSGITIPSKLTADWYLESGVWTWCNLEIKEVKYNHFENSIILV